jgi:hypothetical protein
MFDNQSIVDTRNQWPHIFEHGRSIFPNSLAPPYLHNMGYDSPAAAATTCRLSSYVSSELFDIQPQQTDQWQIIRPEDTLRSLGSPAEPHDNMSGFSGSSDSREEEGIAFGSRRLMTQTDFSQSPSEEPCKLIHGADTELDDISKSDSRFDSAAPSRSGSPSNKNSSTNLVGAAGTDISTPITCTNCSTQVTPLWRRNQEGNPMCNACSLFFRLHGINRPLSLKTDVIKKRKRGSAAESPSSRGRAFTRAARKSAPAANFVSSERVNSTVTRKYASSGSKQDVPYP